MRLVAFCLIALLGACASVATSAHADPRPVLTSICDVIRDPSRFDQQEITIVGLFTSDYFEYSSFGDGQCDTGLTPYGERAVGERAFQDVLCSREGGLVQVTVRGRFENRPGENPPWRFYVAEYSEPHVVQFDPSWRDRWGVLAREVPASWRDRRRFYCLMLGYLDHTTLEWVGRPAE